jgi:hypothetical protein
MNTRSLIVRYFAAFTCTCVLVVSQLFAQTASYTDATGDIDGSISTGNGTLDIVGMEVSETATDLVFTLTVNGNVSSTDWGKFMVGIANSKLTGTTTGNGWGRPINMNSPGGGMSRWIGSWVDGGGGAQLFSYNGTAWSQAPAGPSLVLTPGSRSTIAYTVTKASLDYVEGDVLYFDAYSSGGGGTDSSVDALSNPNVAITTWAGPYTSSLTTGISRYPQAAGVTANITFRVDMNAQIQVGNFDPFSDLVEVLPVSGSAFPRADMSETSTEGIYEVTVATTAPLDSTVGYRFSIVGVSADFPEDLTHFFQMPATATALQTVFFDNIEGYRDVTFRVDMNVPIIAGEFDPLTQSVLVAGNFNGFSLTNPPLVDTLNDGIYVGTFTIGVGSGEGDSTIEYKFYTTAGTGTDSGFEFGGANRSATVELNPDGAFTPAQVLPVAIYGIPDNSRPVTFTVDMSLEVAALRFNPETGNVRVTGSFNDWSTGAEYNLTREAETATYSGTLLIGGNEGSTVTYKYFNSTPAAPNSGYEPGADRVFTLGPVVTPQVLPPAVFGVTATQFRNITFSVDMSVQVALGLFNPEETDPALGGIVQVRGITGFDTGPQLTREGSTLIYSGTFQVGGNGGTTFNYKFWSPGINFYNIPNNTGFEQINLADQFVNRTVTLSADAVAMRLPTVFFSNQLFYLLGTAPDAFSTTQGTASAAQSVTINGQGLTANIVATAPTGFEVSADGITYGSTANLIPASGAVTGTNNLFVRLAASAAIGSPSGNVSLTSTGSQSVNIAASGTVTASGETFTNWSGGESLTPALQLQYAIGGSTSPNATNGVPSVTTVTSNTLSITAVVRTNDPTLTVNGQSLIDLAVGPWTTNNVTMTPQLDAAPEGCQVQTFSTPRGEDSKKFLRLQTTLPAESQR